MRNKMLILLDYKKPKYRYFNKVNSVQELMEIIEFGGSVRITGSTGANLDSSRSHAIL